MPTFYLKKVNMIHVFRENDDKYVIPVTPKPRPSE